MEELILDIISNFNNFSVINFNDETEIENINSENINIQLQHGNININRVVLNFNPLADMFITFDNTKINIYSRTSQKLPDNIVQGFINEIFNHINIENRILMSPRYDIPFRWDELILGEILNARHS